MFPFIVAMSIKEEERKIVACQRKGSQIYLISIRCS